jgi:hypothetical protein
MVRFGKSGTGHKQITMNTAVTAPGGERWQLNPTLSVLAYFVVPDGDSVRRTRLPLADHPEVAAWLLTVLDYVLSVQAGRPGEKQIAPPPGGAAGEAFVRGGVILVSQQPDGGLAMRLNPAFEALLEINTRRRGQPAANVQVALMQSPELSRWLLTASLAGGFQPAAPDPGLFDALRQCGALVSDAPPPAAWFPDPDEPVDLATELAVMSRVILQPAGSPVPTEVRNVLGRHTPALPPGRDIVWGEDAGTGMMYPVCATPGLAASAVAPGREAAARAADWSAQRETARESMKKHGYALLRGVIPPAQRKALRRYVRQLRERGYFPDLDDGQVKLRASIHNEPTIAALHKGLAGIVNTIGPEPVIASYSFLSCYESGAVLDRHLDRPQCRYNICFVLDMQYLDRDEEPEPWPIYLELEGKPVAAMMQVGDGVFFSGANIWHWRDALPPGRRVVVCFSHYVPAAHTGSLD